MSILVLDCTPMMADVVSGATPRPRGRRKRENAFRWLVDATAAWPRVLKHFEIGDRDNWPGVTYMPDLTPPAGLGLDDFPHVYALSWINAPKSGAAILLVNPDGTRCALIDAWEEIGRLWDNVRRPNAGRPVVETDNPKTLAQRRWRDKQK